MNLPMTLIKIRYFYNLFFLCIYLLCCYDYFNLDDQVMSTAVRWRRYQEQVFNSANRCHRFANNRPAKNVKYIYIIRTKIGDNIIFMKAETLKFRSCEKFWIFQKGYSSRTEAFYRVETIEL